MKRKTVNSQLYNYKTYLNYRDKMLMLALNVFQFKGLNNFIDMSLVNKELLMTGSVAWFKDDVTGDLLALPYTNVGSLDIYGRPQAIMVRPFFGSYNRVLYKKRNEFVIMYDNEARLPLYPQITEGAERLALIKRTIDINIDNQLTNRWWKTTPEKEFTLRKTLEQVDSKVNTIVTYDDMDLDETQQILNPAPFVADKLNEAKHEEWAEFLEIIGITSLAVNKKERLITDEVFTSMGGTIASRYNRYEARRKAVEEINKLFNENIEVGFYDGLPSTIKNPEDFLGDNLNEKNPVYSVPTIPDSEVKENV